MTDEEREALERVRGALRTRPITLIIPQVYNEDRAGNNPWGAFADDLQTILASLAEKDARIGELEGGVVDGSVALTRMHARALAAEARVEGLVEGLGIFAHIAGNPEMAGMDDEAVLRIVYDDPEWGDNTVLCEIFPRAFRRAASLVSREGESSGSKSAASPVVSDRTAGASQCQSERSGS